MRFLTIAAIILMELLSQHALADDDDICTDRPSKSTSPCVVPEGHFQIESDTYNRGNDGIGLFTNPTLKFGLGHDLDIEASMIPYEVSNHKYGPGDLYIRLKYEFWNDKNFIQAALEPFIKVPMPSQLSNGFVEGGLGVPIQVNNLPLGFTINDVPEIDEFHNPTGNGYYSSFQNVTTLNHPIFTDRVVGAVELWQQFPLTHTSGVYIPTQRSVDGSLLWLVTPSFQLDCGVNFGINRATPSQVYVGFSKFF
jgi:hypothetical protein